MKYAILALMAVTPASAQTYTIQRHGGQTFVTGSNGYNAFEQRLGGQTFGRDNQGNVWMGNLGSVTVTRQPLYGLDTGE